MVTMDKTARIPVFNADGELQYYIIDAPPSPPDRKLRLGSHPSTNMQIEAKLREHKKMLGYKELSTSMMECEICKKHIPRTHATQKYCKECSIIQKRLKTKLRKQKQRKRKNETGKA